MAIELKGGIQVRWGMFGKGLSIHWNGISMAMHETKAAATFAGVVRDLKRGNP